jgi:NAD(P)-dependent dehydrogenase (short-subunit alcohol dehydrogenase family)
MEFKNKNVLITGGSKGIGRATAIAFSEKGANVAINYRSDDLAAKETFSLLKKGNHILLKGDVSYEGTPKTLVNDFIKKYNTLDVLINNAGVAIFHEIDKVSFEDWKDAWQTTINTNLISVANLCYWASKEMIKNNGGRIVNVSSRGAFRGEPNMPAYGSSKAGLNALSQSLAKSLANYNIGVGVVAPGFTDTDMATSALTDEEKESLLLESPFKRMAEPFEVAHAILFLASKQALYSSGTIIDVNGASYLRT